MIDIHKKVKNKGLTLLYKPFKLPLKYPVIEKIKGDNPKNDAVPVKSTTIPIMNPEIIPTVLPYFIDQYRTSITKKSGLVLLIAKKSKNKISKIQTNKNWRNNLFIFIFNPSNYKYILKRT